MKTIQLLCILFFLTVISLGQEIKMGFEDSLYSEVLNENRKFIIKLPKNYANSDKTFPVFYRLDGSINMYTETLGAVNRLVYMDEVAPELILVMIENTKRNRDMMPTNTSFFQAEPGADNFKRFILEELVPHINASYRTSDERILCGQSLSAIFTIYCFLNSPNAFDSYIACSGGFPDCEDYFVELTDQWLATKLNQPTNIFLTHGMKDFLDPEGVIKGQVDRFVSKIETKENVVCQLKVYEDEGHVPYQSVYHALRFLYASNK